MQTDPTRRTVLKSIGVGGVALAGGVSVASAESGPETLYSFEPTAYELPENVAIDKRGYKYVSMPALGQVWRFSPTNELVDAPFAQLEVSSTPTPFLVGVTGLEVEPQGRLYVNFTSDLSPEGNATNGVWSVRDGEEPELYAELPPDECPDPTFPNDIALFGDSVLVTDSFRGVVYRAWPDGESEVWASGPLLEPTATIPFGANGIAVGKNGKAVYVANLAKGLVVEIPVERDGSAGTPTTFVCSGSLIGSDGLAFDTRGNLYVAVNGQNAIRRVSPGGDVETLARGGDLDSPSDVTFGTARGEQKSVFITNLTPLNPPGDPSTNPSLMTLDVGVPGLPIHR